MPVGSVNDREPTRGRPCLCVRLIAGAHIPPNKESDFFREQEPPMVFHPSDLRVATTVVLGQSILLGWGKGLVVFQSIVG